ncbi:MAG: MFS transporter [Synergistaceae bacterium]|nr:MFS transporter [Synergistaceae bacterium]
MFGWLYSTKAFAALGARNFRIFIFGQTVSLIGTWMQRLAMSWLVLRLTGSAAGLGLVELSNQAPILVTGFFAGSILDRYDMKKILIVTQSLCMVQALALAFLDFSGVIRYTQVLMLSIMLGVIASIDMPARQSCVPRMLDDKNQLNSALTINSAIFNLARLIGPALAGFALQAVGEATCFLLNGLSFMTVIYSLTKLKIKNIPVPVRQNGWTSFKEGLEYTRNFKVLGGMLMLSAAFFFLSNPFTTLLPFFARNIFNSDASALGLFLGSVGLGALIGVIYQASFVPLEKLHRRVALSMAVYGVGITAFACSRSISFSCASLTLLGFGMSTGSVCFNTVIQSIIDEGKRGRVMSLYAICNIGIGPLGSLTSGILADLIGGTAAGLIFGLSAMALACYMKKNLNKFEAPILKILREKGLADIL